ncbi:hypothetical protein [Microcoleus sp. F4-D5]|uniref:hypothetical protein n=1 Tax=Microcoleus sp. F4-D5 TaxID=2818760 RepID=UPI002FD04B5E
MQRNRTSFYIVLDRSDVGGENIFYIKRASLTRKASMSKNLQRKRVRSLAVGEVFLRAAGVCDRMSGATQSSACQLRVPNVGY